MMDDFGGYDAFSAGVELGGLRNTAQIKILIGFIVKSLDKPINESKLVEALCEHGLVNYFDATQALDEQLKCGNLDVDGNGCLVITPRGRSAVNQLESDIPRSVREKALDDAVRMQTIERRMNENKITVEPHGEGFDVSFAVRDGDNELMRLTVYAADSFQVEKIKANFLRDPVSLYSGIIASLFI